MLRGTKGPRMGGGVGGRGFLVVGMRGSTTSLVTVLTVNLNKIANRNSLFRYLIILALYGPSALTPTPALWL